MRTGTQLETHGVTAQEYLCDRLRWSPSHKHNLSESVAAETVSWDGQAYWEIWKRWPERVCGLNTGSLLRHIKLMVCWSAGIGNTGTKRQSHSSSGLSELKGSWSESLTEQYRAVAERNVCHQRGSREGAARSKGWRVRGRWRCICPGRQRDWVLDGR